ncbi:MAG: DMT family transporter [Acidobacteriota bacterium]|nr:DMT family transporter [Acidobacteriota bacterium]
MASCPTSRSESDGHGPSHALFYALITGMVVLWSGNYVIAKIALREFPPLLLSGLRVSLAGLLMLPVYLWKPRRWSRTDVPMLLGLGILGVTANQLFFVLGMSRTSVAHSAIIIGTTPVCVLMVAAILGMERITFTKMGGMALALTGVSILQVFRASDTGSHGGATPLGDFFIFLAALTFALFTVFGKRFSLEHDAITVNTFAYVGGALTLAPMTVWQAQRISLMAISPAAWASLAYMALFPSVICYLIYYYALRRISASRVSAFSYLQPLLATVMAVGVLGERVTWPVIAGGSIIFAGVFLTEKSR